MNSFSDYKEDFYDQSLDKLSYDCAVSIIGSRIPIDLNQLKQQLFFLSKEFEIGNYNSEFCKMMHNVLENLQKGSRSLSDSTKQKLILDLFANYSFPNIMVNVIIESNFPSLISDCIEIGFMIYSMNINHIIYQANPTKLQILIKKLFEIAHNPNIILGETYNSYQAFQSVISDSKIPLVRITAPTTISSLFVNSIHEIPETLSQKLKDNSLSFIRNLLVSYPEMRSFSFSNNGFQILLPIVANWNPEYLSVQQTNIVENFLVVCGHMLSMPPEYFELNPIPEDLSLSILSTAYKFYRINQYIFPPSLYLIRAIIQASPYILPNFFELSIFQDLKLLLALNDSIKENSIVLIGSILSLPDFSLIPNFVEGLPWDCFIEILEDTSKKFSVMLLHQISHILKSHINLINLMIKKRGTYNLGIFEAILTIATKSSFAFKDAAARFFLRFLLELNPDTIISLLQYELISLLSPLLEETDSKILKRLIHIFKFIYDISCSNPPLLHNILEEYETYDVHSLIDSIQDADDPDVSNLAIAFISEIYP